MNKDIDAFRALDIICTDFRSYIESGSTPGTAKPDSPRYFSGGSQPGSIIRYLEEKRCVRVERWEPDYALGGQEPQFLVEPTEYGMAVLEKSRQNDRLTLLPE